MRPSREMNTNFSARVAAAGVLSLALVSGLACGESLEPVREQLDDPELLAFSALEREGLRGGEVTLVVPGSVDQVLAMLLDFDRAAGHRAWAREYQELEREPERVLARWSFAGKLGVEPVVELEFTVQRSEQRAQVDYRLTKKGLGLASFSGQYRVRLLDSEPPRSELRESVFIDSGLPLVNASAQDIERALREDARLINDWMIERLSE